MIQIGPDMAEIQMVQARQAQQQAAAQGIASQWSASQQGMPASPLASVTAANPMGGGLGGMGTPIAGAGAPSMTRASYEPAPVVEEDDDLNWSGAAQGALGGGLSGAQIGTAITPGLGTAVGAGVGALVGGIGGLLS